MKVPNILLGKNETLLFRILNVCSGLRREKKEEDAMMGGMIEIGRGRQPATDNKSTATTRHSQPTDGNGNGGSRRSTSSLRGILQRR